jgi:hypothetical protein
VKERIRLQVFEPRMPIPLGRVWIGRGPPPWCADGAAVGVIVGLALVSAPAAATSEPVTEITFTLDAVQVSAWTNLAGRCS